MLTASEKERREAMVAAGLEHYGACASCEVGHKGVEARLYRCQVCSVKVCYRCKNKHVCEGTVQNG